MENKQKIFAVLGSVILVILLGISFFIQTGTNNSKNEEKLSEDPNVIINNAQKESASASEGKQKEFTSIDMDTYFEYYSGNEAKIILIGYPSCQFCQIADPILHKLAYDFDLEINYLNTDDFTTEDDQRLAESNEFFSEGFGTPLLLIVKDNKIINKVDGLTDTGHYKRFFTEEGFIN